MMGKPPAFDDSPSFNHRWSELRRPSCGRRWQLTASYDVSAPCADANQHFEADGQINEIGHLLPAAAQRDDCQTEPASINLCHPTGLFGLQFLSGRWGASGQPSRLCFHHLLKLFINAPEPNLTSITRRSKDTANFLLRILTVINGIDSTVAVTSRRA